MLNSEILICTVHAMHRAMVRHLASPSRIFIWCVSKYNVAFGARDKPTLWPNFGPYSSGDRDRYGLHTEERPLRICLHTEDRALAFFRLPGVTPDLG